MRLFISMGFDEATEARLLAVQARLRELGSGNFSRPENLHLTLAFLGEVPAARLAAACRAMDETPMVPLRLRFDRVGCFGDLWWIGIAENRALTDLQAALTRNLLEQGFTLERRRFSPHITLARQLQLQRPPDHLALLGAPFTAQADAISLMLSQRVDGRPTYTEQYRVGGNCV